MTDIDPDNWTGWGESKECEEYKKKDLVIQPLTDNFGQLQSQLKKMKPHQLTHLSLGLEFGWHVISPNAPYSEGVAYNSKTKKVIIFLTDGIPTVPAWGKNDLHEIAQVDRNVETLCQNIKETGIIMVTVTFNLKNDGIKKRMSEWATSKEYYFDPYSNSDLEQAFRNIFSLMLKPLRLME